ncbi:MAG: AlpA family phage regulatory protein [Acidobacteriota bacterium]|nr:AlpA family phage regulatory protein [Acidobacteriota bacterium]
MNRLPREQEQFYTMSQTSEIVCLSESSIRRRIERGSFPLPVPVGRRRLFVASEIHEWVRGQITAARAGS